jgi:hypothetical protein
MVITDNKEKSIDFIEKSLRMIDKEFKFFEGSSFEGDKCEETIYSLINVII